jgi:hypothetical protein
MSWHTPSRSLVIRASQDVTIDRRFRSLDVSFGLPGPPLFRFLGAHLRVPTAP